LRRRITLAAPETVETETHGEAGELAAAESLTANQYPSLASSRSKLT
jgi:hypothetical protein